MDGLLLHDDGTHANHLLEDFGHGEMVQANQHVVVHSGHAMILDPGGHKVFGEATSATRGVAGPGGRLRYVFLSHQDPDVVAALNGWLMTTEAEAFVSSLWIRFVPHFGIDRLVAHRLHGIPDGGMSVDLNGCPLAFLPAHFLHSPGNFHVWDPISRILYSGDLGASFGAPTRVVEDFDSHVRYLEAFHTRYMASGRALRAWVRMVRTLPVETVAPQHGAMLRGPRVVSRFLDWCEGLACGVDLIPDAYRVPD